MSDVAEAPAVDDKVGEGRGLQRNSIGLRV